VKASENNIEEIVHFKGSWDVPSKCGLRRITNGDTEIVIVTELYQDNPGSSITSVSASLAMQIAEKYNIDPARMIYIESSPEMHSKLSFYDEEYYRVMFEYLDGKLSNPSWQKLSKEEFMQLVQ
jgi:hypothetical protein